MSPRSFKTGKIPSDVLRRLVFNRLGVPTDRVLSGPGVGEDAAVIDMGDRVLVAKGDPITGAEGNIGWLPVPHVDDGSVLAHAWAAENPVGGHSQPVENESSQDVGRYLPGLEASRGHGDTSIVCSVSI